MAEYRLEMRGVSKSFPGVKSLDKINLKVRPGTVHALMGENGAGKSTLMKCLFGIYHMDEGEVYLDGEKVEIHNPDEALHRGLAMVHQELQPIPERTVAENMYTGRYPTKKFGPIQVIDHKKMFEETAKWLDDVKMPYNPKAKLGTMSIAQMQSVEIAKAVSLNARVVILDEPTSSLTDNEVEALFRIVRDLKSRGVSLIYISHKMAEIREICDDITIMRDGTYVGSWHMDEISDDEIVKQMVGRELTNVYPPKEDYRTDETILKVEHLCSIHERSFQDCSFELKRGEILGFGGLVGAQRTEMVEALFGLRAIASGHVEKDGKPFKVKSVRDAKAHGLALLTEERRQSGVFGILSIEDNTVIAAQKSFAKHGVLQESKRFKAATESNESMHTKTPSMKELMQNLSGGNQQKVLIARWLLTHPDILILDEPTRGIDVGAKYEIYTIMHDLIKEGKSIIMISSEMPELLGMADRVMVMCEGRVTGFLDRGEADSVGVMRLATKFM